LRFAHQHVQQQVLRDLVAVWAPRPVALGRRRRNAAVWEMKWKVEYRGVRQGQQFVEQTDLLEQLNG
jgi:hypothetical protein